MKYSGLLALLLFAALPVLGQTNLDLTTGKPRPMSLQDCFVEAIKHNFDIQVERYTPQISLYNLNGAYGGYDPTFNAAGNHQYDKSGLDGEIPSVGDQNNFSSSLGGSSPWGMTYSLSGNVGENYGHNGAPVTTAFTNFPGPFDSTSGQIQLNVVQPVLKNLWIDGTRLAIKVAKNRLKYSDQTFRQQVITSVTAVENAYYELIFAQQSVEVATQALVLAQTQLDQDQQRVTIGSLAPLDVQQDEAQVASSQASLISAISTLGTDERVLKNLITDEYSGWFNTPIQPSVSLEAPLELFDLQDSWNKGLRNRPDLIQAKLDVEQQGFTLQYDRNQLFPELDLTGTYGYNGVSREFSGTFNQFSEGNRPYYIYGASISVPLSNIKARSAYKSDKATKQQLLLRLKQLEQNIMVDIDNAVGVARSDYESVQANRQARIYAEAALDAEEKKYAVGKSTTFTVLQLQNNLTSARSQEIRALANYNEALATLSQQEASTLERNKIDISVQ
jgi:outer membrane protein TolC